MEYLKGYDRFIEKVPYLRGKRILLLFLYQLLIIPIVIFELILFYSLPALLISSGISELFLAFLPVLGVILVETIGFLCVYQLWRLRDRLKAKYGPTSYSRIFPLGIVGISHVFFLSYNQFIPYYRFSLPFWEGSTLSILATPLYRLAGVFTQPLLIIKSVIAILLLATAILMIIRALFTFGFDYMAVVYLYFPEESTLQNHKIYSILRHPTYGAVLLANFAGMIFTFTPLSVLFFLLHCLGFWIHLHFVEERELIARFGDSYKEYRKRVPAFFVKPKNLGALLGFLTGKG